MAFREKVGAGGLGARDLTAGQARRQRRVLSVFFPCALARAFLAQQENAAAPSFADATAVRAHALRFWPASSAVGGSRKAAIGADLMDAKAKPHDRHA